MQVDSETLGEQTESAVCKDHVSLGKCGRTVFIVFDPFRRQEEVAAREASVWKGDETFDIIIIKDFVVSLQERLSGPRIRYGWFGMGPHAWNDKKMKAYCESHDWLRCEDADL